ncbi:MAG: hypothetical protein ACFWUC_06590 [Oscillospiraceae bacterium]
MKNKPGAKQSHALIVRIVAGICAALIAISALFMGFFS